MSFQINLHQSKMTLLTILKSYVLLLIIFCTDLQWILISHFVFLDPFFSLHYGSHYVPFWLMIKRERRLYERERNLYKTWNLYENCLHSCSDTQIELYSSHTQLDVLYDMSKLIHRKRNFMWICNALNWCVNFKNPQFNMCYD